MEIALVTSAESEIDILPELGRLLQGEIANTKVQIFYSPTTLEIPVLVKGLTEFDFVFVFLLVEKEAKDIAIVKEKVLGLEMRFGMKVAIAVETFEDADEIEASKDALVKKWGKYILDRLFHAEKFRPGYGKGAEK